MSAPVEQVAKMATATFFSLFAELTRDNAPHHNDYPVLARIKRLGLEPGRPFNLARASPQARLFRFPKGQLPPVRVFWSLTLYNDKQFFAANPIDRFAIGDRDKLKLNDDGSLTLYIQRDSPGKDLSVPDGERELPFVPAQLKSQVQTRAACGTVDIVGRCHDGLLGNAD
jgi:hypothetical protein